MIKQGLNIKLGQSMSMTPQLQQAIRLLQLSSVELQQEIQDVLNSNPLLEKVESQQGQNDASSDSQNDSDNKNSDEATDIPQDLKIDADWDDIYDPEWKSKNTSSDATNSANFIEVLHAEVQGLHDHLLWQMEMSNLSFQDKEIGKLIIDYIDDDGYLTEPVEQIFSTLEDILLIELDEVEAVLTYIQNIGPPGIAATHLAECLLLQLDYHYKPHPLYRKITRLLEKNLDLLEKRDYTGIRRTLKLTNSELEDLMTLVRSLDPKPGKVFNTDTTDYITPDVYVSNSNGKWNISLNGETQTELQINDYYANMLDNKKQKPAENSLLSENSVSNKNTSDTLQKQQKETTSYIKENLQQARWFMKSLENRNSTVLNVAQAIVEKQVSFFQYGEEAMKPLVLKDLAEQLGLHESTISRVTTNKYMHTPKGVFEFKHFFSSHVGTDTGGECSATAIRAMIKKLISAEAPNKPLSDNKLTNLLNEQGINIARRTVAKYREALAIPSSHDRKEFV